MQQLASRPVSASMLLITALMSVKLICSSKLVVTLKLLFCSVVNASIFELVYAQQELISESVVLKFTVSRLINESMCEFV